jgi:hypothetical protein
MKSFAILLVLGLGFLVADRIFRIQPLMDRGLYPIEGFKVNNGTGVRYEGVRCGVDLPECGAGLRCANGMCISQEMTMPVDKYRLPVIG